MEDVRIGRKTMLQIYDVEQGTSTLLLLPSDPNRVSLTICNPSSGSLWVGPALDTRAGRGIVLTATGPPLVLNVQDHGAMVTSPWYSDHSAGGVEIRAFATTLLEK